MGALIKILLGILGLSLVVLIHEGGHYIAARLTKIRVAVFSVGFGKRLFSFRRGDTDYRFSLIPLGGYCRFYGEESFRQALDQGMDAIPGQRGDFYHSPPWKRTIVSIAGPLANMLFAAFILTAIAWIGFQEQYTDPRIILVSDYSDDGAVWPADEAGLATGDLILGVDGVMIDRFQELRRQLIFRPEEDISLTVMRGGEQVTRVITPRLDKENGGALIGVMNWVDPVIAEVKPGSRAAEAGFQAGDRIAVINGKPVAHTVDVMNALGEASGTLSVEIIRGGRQLALQWRITPDDDPGIGFVMRTGRSEKIGFLPALARGISESWNIFVSTLRGIRMMFMGIRLQNAVSGPIRLISLTGTTVVEGFQFGFGPGLLMTFRLISVISVSLAFLNLLPIPVLDGGQIILFLTEWVRRRPLRPRSVYRYQFIGTIIVFIIAIVATTGDLMHYQGR